MRNLNALFNVSQQTVQVTEPQADQTATLYKRTQSSKWQVRFKLPTGNWHTASTGEINLNQAKPAGLEIQQRILSQLAAGESISKKTFGEVACEELAAMERAQGNKRAPTTYRDYIFAINKYLILNRPGFTRHFLAYKFRPTRGCHECEAIYRGISN